MKLSIRGLQAKRAAICPASHRFLGIRHTHRDSRQRISNFWIPTVNVQKQDAAADATQLLIRAGYLRQAYAGIFQMLPLGLRVQEKLERLIDKHMSSIRASKVSLSSISSQALWEKSGRFKAGGEMFTFRDRKDTKWLLAPTHEEEITTLLAELIQTPSQLPVRLYQIGRKYRDEKRPRGGLLRGREFLMKDLYTFDSSPQGARLTYDEIRTAYRNFLDELKIKYVEARATPGDMGGDLSHEYHFPNKAGEDTVIACSKCDYARNEEFVEQQEYVFESFQNVDDMVLDWSDEGLTEQDVVQQHFLSRDRLSLVRVVAALPEQTSWSIESTRSINPYAVKAAFSGVLEIDTGVEQPLDVFQGDLFQKATDDATEDSAPSKRKVYFLLDSNVPVERLPDSVTVDHILDTASACLVRPHRGNSTIRDILLKPETGDPCPQCKDGRLQVDKAIEIGHTFHLGQRYSSKLGLAIKGMGGQYSTPVEMGCHGIGVSRLIAASASCLSDDTGLNWPRVIAPFEAVIMVLRPENQPHRIRAAEELYDSLTATSTDGAVDVILDDRQEDPVGLGWKLKDADVIGYPIILVVGKGFVGDGSSQSKVEVQCRRLKIKQEVDIKDAPKFVRDLLKQL